MADIVRYNNHMNTISFGKFNEKELDLFFSICFKLKEEETKKVVLNFSELRELSSYENRNLNRFIKILDSTYNKMLNLNMRVFEDEQNYTRFNLFSEYTISENNKTVTIAINERFRYILNELTGNYTKFELMEFVSLRSSYSKNVFKLLKQWHSVGLFEVDVEEFRRLLDIPIKYRMSDIDKYVLTPIKEELPQHFLNLIIEKIKIGKAVSKLKFTWAKGITVITEKSEKSKGKSKIEVPHGEQLNIFQDKIIKKAEIELTDEEQERRKENIKKQLNSLKNNFQSEQKIEVVENETPIIIEEIEKNDEQINNKIVPDGDVPPGEEIQKEEDFEVVDSSDENKEKDFVTNRSFFKEIVTPDKYQLMMSYEELKEWGEQGVVNIQKGEFADYVFSNPHLSHEQRLELVNLLATPPKMDLVDYTSIPNSELLSKKGLLLVGGALKMRLQKIAKEQNTCIKYNNEVIEPR